MAFSLCCFLILIGFLDRACCSVEMTVLNAKLTAAVDGMRTYLVEDVNNATVKCRLSQSNETKSPSLNVTLKFFQINGNVDENVELTSELKEALELEVEIRRLGYEMKYSCCYQVLNKSLNEHHYCVNIVKKGDIGSATPSSSNCSQSSVTVPTMSTTKQPPESWYGVEFPILVIILSIMVLMVGACVKMTTRSNNNNNNNAHSRYNFTANNETVFYIKSSNNSDSPPSYNDVMLKRY